LEHGGPHCILTADAGGKAASSWLAVKCGPRESCRPGPLPHPPTSVTGERARLRPPLEGVDLVVIFDPHAPVPRAIGTLKSEPKFNESNQT